MGRVNVFLLAFLAIAIIACGPTQREMAVLKINTAKQVAAHGDTIAALAHLDSINLLYPKAEAQVSVARSVKSELYQKLADSRKLMLIRNDSTIAALEQRFNIEKTRFDMYTQYHHKRQTLARTWDRSFLQVHLDERGELYLSSNYVGKEWLNHTGIRVYDGDLQALSERVPLDDPLNHRSDFLDYKWERVSYMQGRSDTAIRFIAENSNLNLKCVFLGNQLTWIVLEDYDKQAVVDALKLSEAIKLKASLEEELSKFEAGIK